VPANIDATAVAELGPALALELAVAGADGVGVQTEAAGELARAGETIARAQLAREDGEDDLGDELTINGDFAAGSKPQSHAEPPRRMRFYRASFSAAAASCEPPPHNISSPYNRCVPRSREG
jgi:hypothetical protein